MAERIEEILASGIITVDHNGESMDYELPDCMKVSKEVFFDKEELLAHCEEHGITLAILQDGFKETRTRLRAVGRPLDVKGVKQRLSDHYSELKTKVRNWTPTPKKQGVDTEAKAGDALSKLSIDGQLNALRKAGFSEEQITALIAAGK